MHKNFIKIKKKNMKKTLKSDIYKKTSRKKSDPPCMNRECRLRKAGCTGYGGCPGYKKEA